MHTYIYLFIYSYGSLGGAPRAAASSAPAAAAAPEAA